MDAIRRWWNSICPARILLLVAVTLPVCLWMWGGAPIRIVGSVADAEITTVRAQLFLLWRLAVIEISHAFHLDGPPGQQQRLALQYSFAYQLHSAGRALALAACAVPLWLFRRRLPEISTIGGASFRVTVLAATVAVVCIAILSLLWKPDDWRAQTPDFLKYPRFFWAYVISTIVIAPVFEEFYYRRIVQTILSQLRLPWYVCVVGTALYFGLSHGTPAAATLTVFALLAGYAYHVSGQLWAPILLHAGLNIWSLVGKLV